MDGKPREKIQLKILEKLHEEISKANLDDARSCSTRSIEIGNFRDWPLFSREIKDPDIARTALYYGFQPLYDAILEHDVPASYRQGALSLLNIFVNIGTTFLVNYYKGRPDLKSFFQGVVAAESLAKTLNNVPYYKKYRNMNDSGTSPNHVASFLKQFLEFSMQDKGLIPDYIVSCACGSSEIAMVLAGILGKDIGFIRRSKRRGDEEAKIIPEHKTAMKQKSEDSYVICIEDYTCTARSLGMVMEQVQRFGPSNLLGASVHWNSSYSPDLYRNIKMVTDRSNFHLYELRRQK